MPLKSLHPIPTVPYTTSLPDIEPLIPDYETLVPDNETLIKLSLELFEEIISYTKN